VPILEPEVGLFDVIFQTYAYQIKAYTISSRIVYKPRSTGFELTGLYNLAIFFNAVHMPIDFKFYKIPKTDCGHSHGKRVKQVRNLKKTRPCRDPICLSLYAAHKGRL